MGIVINRSVISTIVSYTGVIIGAATYLWVFPKYLNPSQIGIIQFVQASAITLASFFQFSGPSTLIRYIPHYKKNEQPKFFNFIFIYILPLLITGIILMYLLKGHLINIYIEKSPEVVPFFNIITFLIITNVFINVFEAYLRTNFYIVIPNLLKDIGLRVFTLVFALLYVLSLIQFKELVWLILISYFIILFYEFIFSLQKDLILKGLIIPVKNKLKEMLVYSSFTLFGSISSVIISRIDILMIGSMLGMNYVGVFTITFFMGNIIDIPRRIVSQVASPIIAKNWTNDSLNEIDQVYKKSALNLLIIGTLIFLGIWANVDFIFSVIPNSEIYIQGKYVILFISLAKLIDMSFGPSTEIINYSKFFRFNLYLSIILSILLIISNLIFIPLYGINGAAFATFMSMIIYNLIKFIFLSNKYSLSPFTKNFLIVLTISFVIFLLMKLINLENVWAEMVFKTILIILLHTGIIFTLKISPEMNAIILRLYVSLFKSKD